jgi:hypothetical protein
MIDFSKRVVDENRVIVPEDYYVLLTAQEIEAIIDELTRAQHDIFVFLGYDKIIEKLNEAKK